MLAGWGTPAAHLEQVASDVLHFNLPAAELKGQLHLVALHARPRRGS